MTCKKKNNIFGITYSYCHIATLNWVTLYDFVRPIICIVCYLDRINKLIATKSCNMESNQTKNQSNSLFKIILLFNVIALTFCIVSQNVNVYRYASVGAIFELLWLPIMAIIILIPFASFYYCYKDTFKVTSQFFYLLLLYFLSILAFYIFT